MPSAQLSGDEASGGRSRRKMRLASGNDVLLIGPGIPRAPVDASDQYFDNLGRSEVMLLARSAVTAS